MAAVPPLTTQVPEGARPLHSDARAANGNTNTSPHVPDATGDPARSPTSSDSPSTNLQTLGASRKGPAKLSRKDTNGKDAKDAKESKEVKFGAKSTSPVTTPSATDPLSQHIFLRTNTERSIASRLRNPARPDSPANETLPRPSSDLPSKHPTAQPDTSREKKKGGSFLSRLSMIGGKRKDDDTHDGDSEISELRPEGANAVAFSSAAVGAAGYIPHHKEPPRYIRMRARHKKVREFDRVFLAQTLMGTRKIPETDEGPVPDESAPGHGLHNKKGSASGGGPIWSVKFSSDGRYLATGGRDRVVRVWAVIATAEDRKAYEEESAAAAAGSNEEHLSAPVFRTKPIREYTGHEADILDLSWSKNNFLLSSSMDKTVRLWHVSREECLCTFKHKDFVTSIAFHPRDDRFFLAGSLDSSLRLWSIPDKTVAYSSQLSDLITAVAFSPDGKTAVAGCLNGVCMFYETEGLKYHTQIHVRSSRGKNAKGSKITGIQMMSFPPDAPEGIVKVLITSNDSRIRMYNLGDKSLEVKLKGHENTCNQIRASFSDDGSYIICGSEDRRAFIWSTNVMASDNNNEKPSCEYFEAHADVVTEAVFAPTKTRQLLQASDDPLFSLCNPPPVTLLSKEEATATSDQEAQPEQTEKLPKPKKPDESPAFIARSNHYDGNIIITTDHGGIIKVFRQDCAFAKRRHENWETGSTFSRKLGREGLLGRTGSIMTRTSMSSRDPHSRRASLSQPMYGLQLNSERINTWRQGIEGNPVRPVSIAVSTPARSERSISPSKIARTPAASGAVNPASEARKQQYMNTSPSIHPTSPTSSIFTSRTNERVGLQDTPIPPTPSFSFRSMDDEMDGLRLDPAGASYSFWNLNKWRSMGQPRSNSNSSGGGLSGSTATGTATGTTGGGGGGGGSASGHGRSMSSTLLTNAAAASSERKNRRKSMGTNLEEVIQQGDIGRRAARRKSMPPGAGAGAEVHEGESYLAPPDPVGRNRIGSGSSRLSSEVTSEEGEETACSKCGGRDFRAKKVSGKQRLLCRKCGRMVDA
ncbi:WD40-repeat-containing domain protein [Xylariomycetidae sp. FL2044]|nr:WD40-repeat-containing domain protein [Xylariomycetidae sp. FL2044]